MSSTSMAVSSLRRSLVHSSSFATVADLVSTSDGFGIYPWLPPSTTKVAKTKPFLLLTTCLLDSISARRITTVPGLVGKSKGFASTLRGVRVRVPEPGPMNKSISKLPTSNVGRHFEIWSSSSSGVFLPSFFCPASRIMLRVRVLCVFGQYQDIISARSVKASSHLWMPSGRSSIGRSANLSEPSNPSNPSAISRGSSEKPSSRLMAFTSRKMLSRTSSCKFKSTEQ
mmetsp:Transcript_64462/g.102232  ORF Transcript_64462/g.102232 Transcript_64462/m.102232 type:complete len:227 (+) Transcript_64462:596-1276(+)